MKRSLIALAVAGAMPAPIIAQADARLYYGSPLIPEVSNDNWRGPKTPKKKKPATKPAKARKSKRQAQKKARKGKR